jgi:hypothetical protein
MSPFRQSGHYYFLDMSGENFSRHLKAVMADPYL